MNFMNIEIGGKTPESRIRDDFRKVVENRYILREGDTEPHIAENITTSTDPIWQERLVDLTYTVQLPGDPIQRGVRAIILGDFRRRITISAAAIHGELSKYEEVGVASHPDFSNRLENLLGEALTTSLEWRINQLSKS